MDRRAKAVDNKIHFGSGFKTGGNPMEENRKQRLLDSNLFEEM